LYTGKTAKNMPDPAKSDSVGLATAIN